MIKNNGLLFEEKLFGCSVVDWQQPVKLDFAEAVAFVKLVQHVNFKWNPAHPRTELALQLFQCVHDLLVPVEDRTLLRLFVAIGTSLDRDHQTDAFFEIEGTSRIALLDMKAGKKKKRVIPPHRSEVSKPSNRVVIHKNDFGQMSRLTSKARKIVDMLSFNDERLRNSVNTQWLQKLLLKEWQEQKKRRKKREAIEQTGEFTKTHKPPIRPTTEQAGEFTRVQRPPIRPTTIFESRELVAKTENLRKLLGL